MESALKAFLESFLQLFPSRRKLGTVSLHRQSAHQMLKKAFIAAGLSGKIAMHSLRKPFAQPVYEQSGTSTW